MKVKELQPVLFGPDDKLEIEIAWNDFTYDVTDAQSPVLETFGDYLVDCVTSPNPFKYTIFLKQEYVKAVEK